MKNTLNLRSNNELIHLARQHKLMIKICGDCPDHCINKLSSEKALKEINSILAMRMITEIEKSMCVNPN